MSASLNESPTEVETVVIADHDIRECVCVAVVLCSVTASSEKNRARPSANGTDMSKSPRIGCVIPRFKLQCGITKPILYLFTYL